METTAAQLRRLIRARARMQKYVKGLSTEDRRAARRAIEARIDFLIEGRRRRISRGPRSQRKAPTDGSAGRVTTIGPDGEKATTGLQ